MDRRFAADEWSALTTAERCMRCQRMAEEAMKLAAGARDELAKGYLKLAEQWLRLAADIERDGLQNSN